MLRAIFGEALLFFVPFAGFALFLALRRRNPFKIAAWSDQAVWLTLAGLVLVAIGLVLAGVTAERHDEGFVPPHLENGRLVPGEFK